MRSDPYEGRLIGAAFRMGCAGSLWDSGEFNPPVRSGGLLRSTRRDSFRKFIRKCDFCELGS